MRVLLLDSQPVVREGLKAFLEESGAFRIVATCGDLRTALVLVEKLAPDVVVTELDLAPRDGGSMLRELRNHMNGGAIVAFTVLASWRVIGRARRAGVVAFVLKTDPLADLADAIRMAARGETYLSRSLPAELEEFIDNVPDILAALSEREREVFHLVVRGLTNRRIGRELFISPKTVDSHRGRIFDKLCCRSAVELVRFAFLNGLVAGFDEPGGHLRLPKREEVTLH